MTSNDPLDAFFKKIDRKGNKHKKQSALTNNEELHKQLVIVTSATSTFKENMDFDEEDDDINIHHRNQIITEPSHEQINTIDDIHGNHIKNQINSSSINNNNNKTKVTTKLTVQDNNNNLNEQQPVDEWEEFEDSNAKYEKLRLKLSRPTNEGDDDLDGDYSDSENNHDLNNINGDDNDEQSSRNIRRREQQDKPVWRLDQVQPTVNNDLTNENSEEKPANVQLPSEVKSSTSGAYRPPQLRGNSSVTVVSGVHQRVSKKEKPNLASTEEFPTLGAGVNKK